MADKIFVALLIVDDEEINADNATEAATWLACAGAKDVTAWEILPYVDVRAFEQTISRSIRHIEKRG